ncbi:thiamine pyrophosphate-binding protein [Streptomyces sp. NPDC005151]
MAQSQRVADFIVEFLHQQGVTHVFGVGGANIEDIYDALHQTEGGPLGVVAKHEYSAATMADGYHRASQRVPVIVSTSGAGAMNLVPGIAELRASYVPALVLIGQSPTTLDGHGSFQETSGLAGSIDALRLFGEIGVHCVRVDVPEAIVEALPRALAAATDPVSPGPAVLLLPKDVQQAELAHPVRAQPVPPVFPAAPEAERARAVSLLRSAAERQGVVVVAGEAVARADARPELARLVRALGARVAVTPDAKDVFDPRDPGYLGLAGVIGTAEVQQSLEQASAVLLAGTRLPQMAGAGLYDHLKGVPVIVVDPRPPFLGAHEDLVRLTGPVSVELALLTTALEAACVRPGLHPPATTTSARAPRRRAGQDEGPLDMRTATLIVSEAMPEGTTVVADAGNAGATAIHHADVPEGGRFIAALGMGGMGHSFGAGVGAAFATGRRSCVIAGDGAFLMHGMEVHTSVEHQLPVTFVILNNNAHGMCATREQLFFSGDYSFNRFRPARIGEGAAALFPGLDATTVRTAAELRTALDRAHTTSSTSLICIDVDLDEMPPFRPFQQHAMAAGKGRPASQGVVPG